MAKKGFDEPRLAINRVYTGRGDAGDTTLVGGDAIGKDAPRIGAYGAVDELNALVGGALVTLRALRDGCPSLVQLERLLRRVQHQLFNLGAILATPPARVHPRQARIRARDVAQLEEEIDAMNGELPPLRSFVLPGGSRLSVELHQCRTVCRRAERTAVALSRSEEVEEQALSYLNRLGDAFFVWSRWADAKQGAAETLWDPNAVDGDDPGQDGDEAP